MNEPGQRCPIAWEAAQEIMTHIFIRRQAARSETLVFAREPEPCPRETTLEDEIPF